MDRILNFEKLIRVLLKLDLISHEARPKVYTGTAVINLSTPLKISWL